MKSYMKKGKMSKTTAPVERERGSFLKNDARTGDSIGADAGPEVCGLGVTTPNSTKKSGNQSKMAVSDRTASAKESGRTYLGTNPDGVTLVPSPSRNASDYPK